MGLRRDGERRAVSRRARARALLACSALVARVAAADSEHDVSFLAEHVLESAMDADYVSLPWPPGQLELREPRFSVDLSAAHTETDFIDVESSAGDERAWDRDLWRIDAGLGCRFDRHLQAKIQYSYSHQLGDVQQGENLLAAQLTFKF